MYNLAQINVAKMKGVNIEDPVMKEFVDALDTVNQVAESSPGFVWRLKSDDNNATSFNPYNDEQIIINVSIWESFQALENFMYKSLHFEYLKRRREWFQSFGKMYTAMWWIKTGSVTTEAEAVDKLTELQSNGPSQHVFDFRNRFEAPAD